MQFPVQPQLYTFTYTKVLFRPEKIEKNRPFGVKNKKHILLIIPVLGNPTHMIAGRPPMNEGDLIQEDKKTEIQKDKDRKTLD